MVEMPRNLKVIFLREENGDGQGQFYYPDESKYVGEWKIFTILKIRIILGNIP